MTTLSHPRRRISLAAVVLVVVSTLVSPVWAAQGSASAGSQYKSFSTPSGNISCVVKRGRAGFIRCDIRRHRWDAGKPPRACAYDYGDAIRMRARRAARFICHSDALPRGRVLAYGDRLDFGKFTCVSERVGLTCINAKRFTFFLSRGSYRIYRV